MSKPNDQKLSASLEDYLEVIFNLEAKSEHAHSTEIADQLGVSKASVTGALRSLKQKGLANYKPYDSVTLTEKGMTAASEIARKHSVLKSFFVDVLGVEEKKAHQAACKAEHTLGHEVITRLLYFIDFINVESENGRDIAEVFKKMYQKQKNNEKISNGYISS